MRIDLFPRLLAAATLLILGACSSLAPDSGPASHFRIYRGGGEPATWEQLIAEAGQVDVSFLGEQHDDRMAHYLEAEILKALPQENLALSLEMFESDVQYVLDEYLNGHISEDHLKSSARAWARYDTDYAPMIEYAREAGMPVIAANAPRRYVNMITRLGEESLLELGDEALAYLPPLPHAQASPRYAEKFLSLMEESGEASGTPDGEDSQRPDPQRMLRAQSMWDASMAHSISEYLKANAGTRILQVNGSFHSAERMGIPDHLSRYRPDTSFLVITMIPDAGFPEFDADSMENMGDFVIVTDPAYQGP